MYARVDKTKENNSRAVANTPSQKKGGTKQGCGFVDNRPEAIAQRKVQERENDSPQVMQLMVFQDVLNNNQKAKQNVQLQKFANDSTQVENVVQFTIGWASLGAFAGGALTAYLTGGLSLSSFVAATASGFVSNYLSNLYSNENKEEGEDESLLAPPDLRGEQAKSLIAYGREWFTKVWLSKNEDYTRRDEIIDEMNEGLTHHNMKLSRGWQKYDPAFRHEGKLDTYKEVAEWGAQQEDGGRKAASSFLKWVMGEISLEKLPKKMRSLAVITHFCEVARGYISALPNLYKWFEKIKESKTKEEAASEWGKYKKAFPPSLKYKEDLAKEWKRE